MIDVKPLPFKPPRLAGLSEKMMASHYENNYGSAVRKLNAVQAEIAKTPLAERAPYLINGVKREELIAHNSVVLHEIYFNGLGGNGQIGTTSAEVALQTSLSEAFGSMEKWSQEFASVANALAGGSGWVTLCYSNREKRLINQWAANHTNILADGTLLFALDMYEHAYHIDFGSNAAAYVDRVMKNLNWSNIAARFRPDLCEPVAAPAASVSVADLSAYLAADPLFQLYDVRLAEDFAVGRSMIDGAKWRDPTAVSSWMGELDATRPIVVHCLYGFHVGKDCAEALRSAGFDAQILSGGISSWYAAGMPVRKMTQ